MMQGNQIIFHLVSVCVISWIVFFRAEGAKEGSQGQVLSVAKHGALETRKNNIRALKVRKIIMRCLLPLFQSLGADY